MTDHGVTEAVIVEVQNILNNLERILSVKCERESGLEMTDIIAIWVLNKCERIIRDFVDKLDTLVIGCVIYTTLQNATPVTMGRNLYAVSSHGIINELALM